MKVSDTFTSKHLKAADLQGRQVNVTIDFVQSEKVGEDMKMVMYFVGKEKGMVLNKTNSMMISERYGDETDDWRDKPLLLISMKVEYQGKMVDGLRVLIPQGRPARPADRGEGRRDAPPPRDDYRDDRRPEPEPEMRRAPAIADDNRGSAPIRPMASADIDDEIPFAPEWR